MLEKAKKYKFLFEELVKRDFKKKYKRTALGIMWSLFAPLLQLLVMSVVFKRFFGNDTPYYTTYLFAGNIVFSFYRESTNGGMTALTANMGIISKVNVPKYLFLLSKNVSSFINFLLILVVFFVFVALDGIAFSFRFFLIIYPVITLLIFNIGVGLILSALYIMFKDIGYLYDIFLTLLMYLSAVFYNISRFPEHIQKLFYMNPIYVHIRYIRMLIIDGLIPTWRIHFLCFMYAAIVLIIGAVMYKKNNYKFLYYT